MDQLHSNIDDTSRKGGRISLSISVDITVRQYRGSGEAETACPDQETDALTA